MLLERFDDEKYERSLRREAREEGKAEGIEEGRMRVNQLTSILLEAGRTDDLKRAVRDPEYQEQLFREFKL